MRRVGLFLLLAALFGGNAAAAGEFPLRGSVTDQEGRPLEAVEIQAVGEQQEFRAFTAGDGTFELPLPQGEYDILFTYGSDYYPTRIEGVQIRLVKDPEFENPEPGGLRVTLSKRLRFELDQVVIGPRYVDPPALKVEFLMPPAPTPGAEVAGTLLITNLGPDPVDLPAVQESGYPVPYSPDMLLMQAQVEIPELEARFDRPYVCRPNLDCRTLKTSESLRLAVTVHTRESHQDETPRAATHPAGAAHRGTVRVYLVYPGGGERPTYTRPVQAEFSTPPAKIRSP